MILSVIDLLKTDSAVNGVVGGKIFSKRANQTVLPPYILIHKISTTPAHTKSGVSTLDQVRIQVDTISATRSGADTLADAVRAALDRKSGIFSSVTVQQTDFQDQRDEFDTESDYYRVSQDYIFRIELS